MPNKQLESRDLDGAGRSETLTWWWRKEGVPIVPCFFSYAPLYRSCPSTITYSKIASREWKLPPMASETSECSRSTCAHGRATPLPSHRHSYSTDPQEVLGKMGHSPEDLFLLKVSWTLRWEGVWPLLHLLCVRNQCAKCQQNSQLPLLINSISLAGIILRIFLICDNWQKIKNKIKNLFFGYFSGV